jgi:hypothetical protein
MRVLFFLTAFVFTFSLQAQNEYHAIYENDDILISYKVMEVKSSGALVPQIRLSLQNKSQQYLKVNFDIELHLYMEMVEAFKVEDFCIAPGKTAQGRIKGLFYNPESITYDQLLSTDFEIEMDEYSAKKLDSCD